MTDLERHSYDVVVIGAGGAGLRAAIEAREQGKRTAIICKSLFGKAHTVMAEGGIAASMGNVNSKDSWQVHFRDTMRGGKFLNHWRMAELHAKEAPQRVWELETWGALFDRTPDGRISQRNFGGHEYPRLAHVGDRTGLELIRTLQQKIVSLQQEDERELGDPEARLRVFAECTITEILKDGDRVAGAFGYWRESGRFVAFDAPAVVLATGGIGKSFKVTSNSWEYTGDGHALALEGRRRRWSTWSSSSSTRPAWSGRRASRASSSPSRCAATAASSRTPAGSASCSTTSPTCSGPSTPRRGRGRPLVHRPRQQPAATGAAPPRRGRPRDQLRGQGRPWLTARRRLPRRRQSAARRDHPQEAALDVPPVQGARRRRHHGRADGGRTHLPLRDGRRRGRARHRGRRRRPWPVRRRRGGRRHARLEPARAATRCPTCSSSDAGPGPVPPSTSTQLGGGRPAVGGVRHRPGSATQPSRPSPATAPRTRTPSTPSCR